MAERKQNLVLFFEENEEFNVINSRLVRMYMNRFTIDEEDQTEVTEVYDIKSGLWKEYTECFLKSLERKNETANTDTHFILGNETKSEFLDRSFSASINELIASYHCRPDNCHAVTFLSGSIEHKFLSEINQGYQYQQQDEYEQKSLLWKIVHAPYYEEKWETRKFEQSINDDLEWFQQS